MIINFLQTRSPKILPTLQKQPFFDPDKPGSGSVSFADDLESLKGFGKANKESLGDLLFGFFRRYAHEIDYERSVISVREGSLVTKQSKNWHFMQNNRLCVEEPFNVERNLGNTADDTSFRGVHLELRRAFDYISQAKLEQCCEQYIFPAHEEKFWSKPPVQPKPVLTRSLSQTGRPAKQPTENIKGGSSGSRHRAGGASNRRASSAAAMNKLPMYGTLPPLDRLVPGNQLHDQLFQHYQLLQHQEISFVRRCISELMQIYTRKSQHKSSSRFRFNQCRMRRSKLQIPIVGIQIWSRLHYQLRCEQCRPIIIRCL